MYDFNFIEFKDFKQNEFETLKIRKILNKFLLKIKEEKKGEVVSPEIKDRLFDFLISQNIEGFRIEYEFSKSYSDDKIYEGEHLKLIFNNNPIIFYIMIKTFDDERGCTYDELLKSYDANSYLKSEEIEKDEKYLKENLKEINNKINKYNSLLQKLIDLKCNLNKKIDNFQQN